MAQVSNRGTRLFCLLFVVIGLVAVSVGVSMMIKSLRTEHWPVTDGVIQSAEMKSHSGSKGGTTYSAEVTYTYQVAGTGYTGDKVSIGQMSSSSEYARGILNRYPIGKKVSVHYQPGDPSEAVLETGIHGGTWICLGVGTAFTLFGIMFLQISRATAKAQMPGAPQSPSVKVLPDGRVTMNKPPVLMGVIFILMGSFIPFGDPAKGVPHWMLDVAGGIFIAAGIAMLLVRLQNKIYAKTFGALAVLLLLAAFNWVSFGPGERIGTVTTPFGTHTGVNVKTGFAVITSFFDLIMLAFVINWLLKRPAEVTSSRPTSGQPITKDKSKVMLVAGLVLLLAITAIFFVLHKSPAQNKSLTTTEKPFVSTPIDDAFWLNLDRRRSDKYRKLLKAAPPVLVVRESHYAFNPTNGMGMHYGWLDGRLANLRITLSELVADAYGKDNTHTEFPEEWTHGSWTNCYDVIVTVTNQPKEALQSAAKTFLRQQYGLAWHLETRATDVLVLRAKDLPLLQSKATRDFARSKSIPEFTNELENYFGRPVIDETGATNRFDKTIGDVPSRWVNGRTTDLEANNQFLATVGLELVATDRPQEWLVMDR
jgi:uncharacterized protein (TIGR03435 family)